MQELRRCALLSPRSSPRALYDRVLTARVGEGTSVAADGGKFLGKVIEWRLITEKHDIENLLEVRIALEGVAAANMALNGTDADIAKLGALLAKMKSSVS